jgi:hypothetical protein
LLAATSLSSTLLIEQIANGSRAAYLLAEEKAIDF